jgi:hypothetical protein
MYLKRYHDVEISTSGAWRILKQVVLSRLPAYQRYQRHDRKWKRYEKPKPGHAVQVDVKFIAPLSSSSSKKYYQFTAIDDCTRIRVLRLAPRWHARGGAVLARSADTARLLCFPHAGGSAAAFSRLSSFLTPDIELLAVEYPGRLERREDPPAEDISAGRSPRKRPPGRHRVRPGMRVYSADVSGMPVHFTRKPGVGPDPVR